MSRSQPKVLIIGVDGATFDLIKPWVAAGKLPTFERLLRDGIHSTLESVIPPYTPPAWTSFMTGMNPGKHGVFNFIRHDPADYSVRYTNGSNCKAPTMWKWLSDMGWRVGLINVPMTYPPEKVNGYCISGLDTPDKDSPFVYPAPLKAELEQRVGEIYLDPRHLGYMKTDDRRAHVLEALVKIEKRRTEIAEYLMREHPVDVMMLVYTGADSVQHFFWQYMDEGHPAYDPVGAEKYRETILNMYQVIDGDIAKLLDLVDDECAVVVVSDHGSGPLRESVVYLNQWLQELGLLVYKTGRKTKGSYALSRVTSALDGYLRGALSPGQKAWLAKAFPALYKGWESYTSSIALIDWAKTRAYCLEFLSFPSEIWINVEGRTAFGTVKPGAEYEALIAFLTERLYELKDQRTGRPLIPRVYRREEVYEGAYVGEAPDLILSWWGDRAFQVGRSAPQATHPCVVDKTGMESRESASWSGTHNLDGIFLVKGGPFRTGKLSSGARLVDLAPTLLHLLDVPIPTEMDGKVLLEAFREDFAWSRPVRYLEGGNDGYRASGPEVGYTAAEAEQIQRRLNELGYIE